MAAGLSQSIRCTVSCGRRRPRSARQRRSAGASRCANWPDRGVVPVTSIACIRRVQGGVDLVIGMSRGRRGSTRSRAGVLASDGCARAARPVAEVPVAEAAFALAGVVIWAARRSCVTRSLRGRSGMRHLQCAQGLDLGRQAHATGEEGSCIIPCLIARVFSRRASSAVSSASMSVITFAMASCSSRSGNENLD